MAAAWFNALANPTEARAISAGTEPGPQIHPDVLVAMNEVGIDLSRLTPQLLTDELARGAQVLVTLGCGERCPVVLGVSRDDWPLEDPKGKPLERVREIRDELKQRVQRLIARHGWAANAAMESEINDRTRDHVRAAYGKVANGQDGCNIGCCGTLHGGSLALGYTSEDLARVPEGADLGLGCGNAQSIAALQAGETVVDLGCGAGFDCFLAACRVGPQGRVIGVDMTPEMISRARDNGRRIAASNVEFRLGEIERLPVADACADVVLSNCVINLSPDKAAVFHEAHRVLKPGGRLAIFDLIATASLPPELRESLLALTGCIAGAGSADLMRTFLRNAGFYEVKVRVRNESREIIGRCLPGAQFYVASATIEAVKPAAN
jgi:SAM-dependent methyltransferase/protein-tyrosine-phosphatase